MDNPVLAGKGAHRVLGPHSVPPSQRLSPKYLGGPRDLEGVREVRPSSPEWLARAPRWASRQLRVHYSKTKLSFEPPARKPRPSVHGSQCMVVEKLIYPSARLHMITLGTIRELAHSHRALGQSVDLAWYHTRALADIESYITV